MNMRPNDELEHGLLAEWMEAADIGLCAADDAGRAVMVNKAACRQLDVDHMTALNRPLRSLFRSVDDGVALSEWLTSSTGSDEWQVNHAGHAGKRNLRLKKRQLSHASGEVFSVIAITDITELVETQRRLEVQKREGARHRQWQALNAGVVITDALSPDMPIVYVNPAFEQLTGYSATEALGRNCRFLQGPEPDQATLGPLRNALRNGSNGYAVLRNYRKDGSLFINELFVSAIRDSSGQVIQFVGIQHLRTADGSSGGL